MGLFLKAPTLPLIFLLATGVIAVGLIVWSRRRRSARMLTISHDWRPVEKDEPFNRHIDQAHSVRTLGERR